MARRIKLLLIILTLFWPLTFANAAVIHMERSEIIQRSKTIFTGTVASKIARRNNKGNLIVTDYTFVVEEVLYGQVGSEVVLTFAGGQLAEEGQSVSDVPSFKIGDKVLLMLEESDTPLLSPVTGMYLGKYSSVSMPSYGMEMAFDGDNLLVKDKNDVPFSFSDFVLEVKKEIPVVKSMPLPDRSVPAELESFVLKNLPSQVYDPSPPANELPGEFTTPKRNDPGDQNTIAPPPGSDTLLMEESDNNSFFYDTESNTAEGEAPQYWSYSHRAKNVPIVFNQLPSGGLIGDHDQYQMGYWNDYADIFRVYVTPTGTWAWENGRYDIAGFVDNQTMIDQFGQGWGSNTLAVCWKRWDYTGFSIEADIALNPAFSWTVDDYTTYRNANLFNADRTLLHEIGHAWGLDHQWYALSVMNYAPHKYRAYTVLYGDDTMAVRDAFSGQAVSRTDLGVSLFYPNGYQNYDDSNLSTQTITQGTSFTVSNFMLENSGTNTVTTPTISWYLVPNINSWSGSRYIGQTTHSSLSANNFFLTSRSLSVPTSVPPGTYYLAASIATTETISSNNNTWLDRLITIVARPPSTITATDGTYTDRTRITWSTVTGASTYRMYRCTTSSTSSCTYLGTDASSPYDDFGGTPGRLYYYRVKATSSTGDSGYSTYNTGYRALSTPATPTATDGTYTDRVRISWSTVTGATTYRMYRCTTTSTSSCTYLGTDASSPYDDFGGTPGRLYYYRIRASSSTGDSGYSSYNTGYRALSPPATPTATDGTYTDRVRISWSTVTGATTYRMYRCTTTSTSSCTYLGTDASSPYDDFGGTPGRLYYYRIRASSSTGDSGYSSYNTGYRALSPPPAPTATDGTYTDRVRISWSTVTGATTYKIYRCTTSLTSSCTYIATDPSSPYDDLGGTPGTLYYYRVTASSSTGDSGYSAYDNGYRTLSPPATPTATDGTYTDRVRISWSTVTGATTYKIYRCTTSSSSSCTYLATDPSSPYDDFGGISDTVYYYRVIASSSTGDSGYSAYDTGYREKTLTGLTISGPLRVPENSSAVYSATASWDNGTSGTVSATWSQDSPDATIDSDGILNTSDVTGNQNVTITAVYSDGVTTLTDTFSIVIVDAGKKFSWNLFIPIIINNQPSP